jgi:hypothetical protein
LLLASSLCLGLWAEELFLRSTGDSIHISAPKLHFLTGRPLERLKNGNAVTYDFQLSILSESRIPLLPRTFERFVFSYDLWEERFSVSRTRNPQSRASHLTASAAEAWAIDNISFSPRGVPPNQPIFLKLEIRAADPKDERLLNDDSGVSLSALIEIFSRASKAHEAQYWKLETGPVQLQNIAKSGGRGSD